MLARHELAGIDPARYLGRERKVGLIAPGKCADLVVIDGDPLARIDDIARTAARCARASCTPVRRSAAVGVEPFAAADAARY